MFLVQLFGLILLIAGVGLLHRQKTVMASVTKLAKDELAMFMWGMIALAAGLSVVLHINEWNGEWYEVLITLLGWIMVIKGALLVLLPASSWSGIIKKFNNPSAYWLKGLIMVVLGLYLCAIGFGWS